MRTALKKSSRSGESGLGLGTGMGLYECDRKSFRSEERTSATISANYKPPSHELNAGEPDEREHWRLATYLWQRL